MTGIRNYKLTGMTELLGEGSDEFFVDIDVRRNIRVVFLEPTEFEEGDEIYIVTDSLQKEIVEEFKANNKRKTK